MEYKAYQIEVKATGDQGQYEGHFAVFNNVDDGGDIIRPGAFSKTIAERRPRIRPFYMHDPSKPMGPAPEQLSEDTSGLYAKGRLTLGNSWTKDAWELIKDGALTEGSIGYLPIPDKTDFSAGVRVLNEVKLFEYSFVSLGMNPLTSVQAVKSLRLDADTREESLFAIVQEGLAELKIGRAISASRLSRLQAALDTLAEIIKDAEPAAEEADHSEEPEAEKTNHSNRLTELRIREADLIRKYAELGVHLN